MEIELRAFLNNFEEIELKLKELKSDFLEEVHIIDLWFCEQKYTAVEQVLQHKPGSYALRIRTIEKDGNKVQELNTKVLKSEGDHNVFIENETKISDADTARKILENIGFKVFCTVDKIRKVYKLDNISINLENIKGYKPAVELEIISDEDEKKHMQILHELLDKLGIKKENIIKKSITNLYMTEFSKF